MALPSSKTGPRLVQPDEQGSSLAEVYRRFGRYVGAVVLRLDGRCDEVDDLVQDVFVEAARGIERLRDPQAVKGWLSTITVRVVRRRLRMRRLCIVLGLDGEADYSHLIDPSASAPDRMLVKVVYQVLDEQTVNDRLAFCLHHIEGENLETVARLCGCSCATAKRRIARVREAIEERFSDE